MPRSSTRRRSLLVLLRERGYGAGIFVESENRRHPFADGPVSSDHIGQVSGADSVACRNLAERTHFALFAHQEYQRSDRVCLTHVSHVSASCLRSQANSSEGMVFRPHVRRSGTNNTTTSKPARWLRSRTSRTSAYRAGGLDGLL